MNVKKFTVLVIAILFFTTTIFFQEISANSLTQNATEVVPNGYKNRLESLHIGGSNKISNKIFTEIKKRELQNEITNRSDEYKIVNAGLTSNPTHTLYFSLNGNNNHFYIQIFKGHLDLHNNHKIIEKQEKWSLVPESQLSNKPQQKKYIIAVSEITYKNNPYTIIIQSYDIQTDSYATPYTKAEILNFANAIQLDAIIKVITSQTL
ncbi:hypothetical protein SAMN05443252_103253 [Bacillus sp. OV322]|uniref:hypothetical protein n=1 Tax=Bacillus sp. OV322 TaxID=1882764 RepID=UPI0008EC65D9|nr:hypothetical protein [Bacillus sp. OV322]SFC40633.1 hypothetical protein SAMN05443252_103253 [Bacillus sp. OV322]